MEQYVIEERITFYPTEKTLCDNQSGTSLALSLTAAEILQMLLSNHGQVVTRETLFSEIFDRRGTATTNNNLNQYMLNLRKQLLALGLESDVIQTVPRIGFIVPSSVSIDAVSDPQIPQAPLFLTVKKNREWATKVWLVLMVAVTAIALLFLWQDKQHNTPMDGFPDASAQPINEDKMCQILAIPSGIDIKKGDIEEYHEIIRQFTPPECEPGVPTRYYVFHSGIDDHRIRDFVLRCTFNNATSPICFSWHSARER